MKFSFRGCGGGGDGTAGGLAPLFLNFLDPPLKKNRNGDQHGKQGKITRKLVFDAAGKYIHPTRYRLIVETQSVHQLTSEEQRVLSEDRKHSSAVAKVHYQKQPSLKVALKGHECLQKLQGAKGSEVDEDVYARLGDSTSDAGPSVETVHIISSTPKWTPCLKRNLRFHRNIRHNLIFKAEEDRYLKEDITELGCGQWTAILILGTHFKRAEQRTLQRKGRDSNFHQGHEPELNNFHMCYSESSSCFCIKVKIKVKNDHRSKFSNLSNWKEEA